MRVIHNVMPPTFEGRAPRAVPQGDRNIIVDAARCDRFDLALSAVSTALGVTPSNECVWEAFGCADGSVWSRASVKDRAAMLGDWLQYECHGFAQQLRVPRCFDRGD